ncbi:carbohydrate ABC transporter permease [Bifidobacterium mongoliense]|jgi:multiple sugar transport system permease protein|uniref:carbohydrate ABC transporter permease n=1 Tax=Bifidobacterium mongoliense TaxID=518643 RepID=UPI0030EB8695
MNDGIKKSSKYNKRADGSVAPWYSAWTARIILFVVLLLFLLPIYWMVVSAVKSPEELAQYPPSLWPKVWHWENFGNATKMMPFLTYFRNTVIITALSTLFNVLANFIIAYGFSCIEWPWRNKIFFVVIATLFIPMPVTLIPMFDFWAGLHTINTFIPLVVPALFGSGFNIFLLRQFMSQIPKDLLDAGRVDGASEWKLAWSVVFPMTGPALTAIAIFSAVGAWNDFMGPLIYLHDEKVQTLAIGLQFFKSTGGTDVNYGLLMAASVLVLLPLVLLFFVFQRYFISGITMGAFK